MSKTFCVSELHWEYNDMQDRKKNKTVLTVVLLFCYTPVSGFQTLSEAEVV